MITFALRVKTEEDAANVKDAMERASVMNRGLSGTAVVGPAESAQPPVAAARGLKHTGGESANCLTQADAKARAARVSKIAYSLALSLTAGATKSKVILACITL